MKTISGIASPIAFIAVTAIILFAFTTASLTAQTPAPKRDAASKVTKPTTPAGKQIPQKEEFKPRPPPKPRPLPEPYLVKMEVTLATTQDKLPTTNVIFVFSDAFTRMNIPYSGPLGELKAGSTRTIVLYDIDEGRSGRVPKSKAPSNLVIGAQNNSQYDAWAFTVSLVSTFSDGSKTTRQTSGERLLECAPGMQDTAYFSDADAWPNAPLSRIMATFYTTDRGKRPGTVISLHARHPQTGMPIFASKYLGELKPNSQYSMIFFDTISNPNEIKRTRDSIEGGDFALSINNGNENVDDVWSFNCTIVITYADGFTQMVRSNSERILHSKGAKAGPVVITGPTMMDDSTDGPPL